MSNFNDFPNITIATIGHIDHGKSSLLGRLLYDSGQVNTDRIIELQKTGENNFAFLLDSFEDEQKGKKTIDIFYSQLKTKKYRFTLIDNPGHLGFIKNMLTGVSQANGAILVISAKPGEGIQFQTKRHMILANLLGINQVLVLINKMDLVNYNMAIFNKIKKETIYLLKEIGFIEKEIKFVPVSAQEGDNVYQKSINTHWYKGKTFYQLLDEVFTPPLLPTKKPLRASLQGIFNTGTEKLILARIETGILRINSNIVFLPSGERMKILKIRGSKGEQNIALPGEAVGVAVNKEVFKGLESQILGENNNPPRVVKKSYGKIFLLINEPFNKNDEMIFRCGTRENKCKISKIIRRINSETGKIIEKNTSVVKPDEMADIEILFNKPVVIEKFSEFPSLGRFLLYREKKNIAAGIIIS